MLEKGWCVMNRVVANIATFYELILEDEGLAPIRCGGGRIADDGEHHAAQGEGRAARAGIIQAPGLQARARPYGLP